jgi:hypothetical protein
MQDRQKHLDEMRAKLAASISSEKEAIKTQADAARISLEAEGRRLAVEIGSRVLGRPISGAGVN